MFCCYYKRAGGRARGLSTLAQLAPSPGICFLPSHDWLLQVDAHVGALLARALDSSEAVPQQEAMKALGRGTLATNFGYACLKEQLLPRVHALVMGTTSAAVR